MAKEKYFTEYSGTVTQNIHYVMAFKSFTIQDNYNMYSTLHINSSYSQTKLT